MKPSLVQDIIEAIYPYKNANGEIVIEKVRKAGKKFSIRRPVNGGYIYKEATKGLDIPLYNLPDVARSDTVYIVEGEKDVETLRELGLVATCNFDGAGKWKDCYSETLKGKSIVILPDNDSAGDKHCNKVIASLKGKASSVKRVDLPGLKEHGDVTDYISNGGTRDSLAEIIEQATVIDFSKVEETVEKTEKPKKVEVPHARYDDYVHLYESVLGNPKRDIFSQDLHFSNEFDEWEPAANACAILESEAATLEDIGAMKYKPRLLVSHMAKYERSRKPELLINIPNWDGVDRVKLFADCLVPSKSSVLIGDDFDQLLSDWLCKMYRRIFDPNVRNRILVLKGPQQIGKDWWQDSLLVGLGQFMEDLTVVSGDKDSYMALSRGAVLKIAEFEKTAKTEVSIIKDMVTKPFTNLRAPYGTGAKKRWCRCSFISTSNNSDLLRDSTGSTRFIIFDLERIKFDYPVRDTATGLQILAQARELARGNFKCNAATEKRLHAFLSDHTPDDIGQDIIDSYHIKCQEWLDELSMLDRMAILKEGWASNTQLSKVIKEVAQACEVKERYVRMQLKINGLGKHTMNARGFIVTGIKSEKEVKDEGFDSNEDFDSVVKDDEYDDEIPF